MVTARRRTTTRAINTQRRGSTKSKTSTKKGTIKRKTVKRTTSTRKLVSPKRVSPKRVSPKVITPTRASPRKEVTLFSYHNLFLSQRDQIGAFRGRKIHFTYNNKPQRKGDLVLVCRNKIVKVLHKDEYDLLDYEGMIQLINHITNCSSRIKLYFYQDKYDRKKDMFERQVKDYI